MICNQSENNARFLALRQVKTRRDDSSHLHLSRLRFSWQQALALILFLVCTLTGNCQIDRGSITGTVTDASGGVLVGVSVVATNNATGVSAPGVTNGTGTYRIAELPIGNYSVTFKFAGYRTINRTNVDIKIGQNLELNEVLPTGDVTQTVEVTSAVPLLETQRSTIDLNFDSEALKNLPLDVSGGRDITTFAYKLTPTTTGGNYSGHIAGSQDMTKNVIVDGTDASAGLP